MEDDLEQAFKKLEKAGKNSVDNLLNFMKDAKIIEKTNEAEQQARDLFSNVQSQEKVALGKFQEVIQNMSKDKDSIGGKVEGLVGTIYDSLSEQTAKLDDAVDKVADTIGGITKETKVDQAVGGVFDSITENTAMFDDAIDKAATSIADVINNIIKK